MVIAGSKIDFYDKSIKAIAEYYRRTPKSRELYFKAKRFLPGGDTRSVTFFKPYPLFMAFGVGCKIYDVDGNEYVDFINNYSSQVLGHAHPSVVKAVQERFAKGNAFAAPVEEAIELASILCNRIPSIETLRFANSGTEAIMMAIRAARFYTGRSKIVKVEGGYHGSSTYAEVSIKPDINKIEDYEYPEGIPELGVLTSAAKEVLIVPFNNIEITEKIIRENKRDIAAFIIEPIAFVMGTIPVRKDYLKFVREITEDMDIILIFDEVVTFRVSEGGAQEFYGITPDMTCLGKMIGGGLPIGAFGGKEEIMDVFSPEREEHLTHSRTFNANAATMAAGIAVMKEYKKDKIEKINKLGNTLRKEITKTFEEHGVIAKITGEASLFNIHFTPNEIYNYRTASTADKEIMRLLHIHLLNKGVFMAPRGAGNLSTPMDKKEIKFFIEALNEALSEAKPYIRKFNPTLLY